MNLPMPLVAQRAGTYYADDPIRRWRCNSVTQRRFIESVASSTETLLRTGNIFGKTAAGAVCTAAFLRGEERIEGRTFAEVRAGMPERAISLPLLGVPPIKMLLVVPAYKSEGATEAMDKFLGAWPHETRMVAQGSVGIVYVRPNRWHGSDFKKWSRLIVFPDKGTLPKGLRLNGAWGDEVISSAIWFEALMRRIPGHHFPSYLTLTPGKMKECRWIKERFPDVLGEVVEGLMHLNAKASENQLLTSSDLERIRVSVQRNPYAKAALNGDWVDTSGDCPFDVYDMERWADYAEAGERGEFVMLDDGARWIPNRNGDTTLYRQMLPGETCWVIADPSSGIRLGASGKAHDPSAMWVVSQHRRCLMARYHGFRTPARLKDLMIAAGYYYGEAELIPEANGEFGGALVTMLMAEQYPHVYLEERHDSATGQMMKTYGWHTTARTRGLLVSALQEASAADSIDVYSIEAIDSLRQVIIEPETERIVAGAGYHDEDLICGGIFAHLLKVRGVPEWSLDRRPRTVAEAVRREMEGDLAAVQDEGYGMSDEVQELTLG